MESDATATRGNEWGCVGLCYRSSEEGRCLQSGASRTAVACWGTPLVLQRRQSELGVHAGAPTTVVALGVQRRASRAAVGGGGATVVLQGLQSDVVVHC